MPTVNIPARLRFALYLVGVLGSVLVQYLLDVDWFGEAEQRAWSGVSAVLFALAAARVDLTTPEPPSVDPATAEDEPGPGDFT